MDKEKAQNLIELVFDKLSIEDQIAEAEGVLDEEMEITLELNDRQLREKLDAYGYMIDHLKDTITYLKLRKELLVNRLSKAINRADNLIKRLKERIFTAGELLDEKHLHGDDYKFHPFMAQSTVEVRTELCEEEYGKYVLPPLSYDEYQYLLRALGREIGIDDTARILKSKFSEEVKRKIGVKDLPPDHKAVIKELTKSTRIT
jgi:hypothetical protein